MSSLINIFVNISDYQAFENAKKYNIKALYNVKSFK